MTLYIDDQHTNREGQGWCCPHCLESHDYDDGFGTVDGPVKVTCKSCGKEFGIYQRVVCEHVSGFIEEEDDD